MPTVPDHFTESHVEELIESREVWIYKSLAEWRDLNATRAEWRDLNATRAVRVLENGEGFLYLGRS